MHCKHLGKKDANYQRFGQVYHCPIKGLCCLHEKQDVKGFETVQQCSKCDNFEYPMVSVIITCHNYGKFLLDAFKSVERQTIPAFQIIIVDDASDDDTAKIAGELVADLFISKYIRVDVQNVYLARKAGLAHATGDYVVFLDADDMLEPTYFEECLEMFQRDPKLGLVSALLQQFGESNGVLFMPRRDINQANWLSNATMAKREALIQSGAFDRETLDTRVAEDWLVWRKVINAGWDAERIEKPLIKYRRHERSRWDNVLQKQSYYELADLEHEPIVIAWEAYLPAAAHGEYLGINEPSNDLLRLMERDTAGVTGEDGSAIIRRSVLRQFPTDDPTTDEWKRTVTKAGYKWVHAFVPPKPIQAVIVTPFLTFGGAEQWVRQLATLCDPELIQWRVVMTGTDSSPAVVNAIRQRSHVYCVNNAIAGASSYRDAAAAINAAAAGADVLVTWGDASKIPVNVSLPIVLVSHSDCGYSSQLNREAVGTVTHFVCVSERVARNTTTPAMQAAVIWNGANESRLAVNTDRKLVQKAWGVVDDWWFSEKIFVGTIARAAIEKNIVSMIAGVSQLPRRFEFVLIGDGPEGDELDRIGESLLGNRYHHESAVDAIGDHLNALDVFLLTSDFEGGPIAVFEAMLAGVPVVTTRVGSIPELEDAAGESLCWSLPDLPTGNEVAEAIRDAYRAGRESPRVKAAKAFAQKHLTASVMVKKWTDHLAGIVKEWRDTHPAAAGAPMPPSPAPASKKFAYVTGTNRHNEKPMIETMIKSARAVGVTENFFLFGPMPVEGAIHKPFAGDWKMHMAKIDFLLDLVEEPYDYFVWLDTDNYFVRHPGDFSDLLRDEPCWVSMESDLTSPDAKFKEWYGLFLKPEQTKPQPNDILSPTAPELWQMFGAKICRNTNGGMFIVRREAIREFHGKCWGVFNKLHALGFGTVPDEPPLAIVGASLVSHPELNTPEHHSHLWACDWHHAHDHVKRNHYTKTHLPDGTPWLYKDWLTQTDQGQINPAIVHLMRGKELMNNGHPFHWQAPPPMGLPAPVQVMSKEPVGTKLHEILAECGVKPPGGCKCREMAGKMDTWGIDGCQQHRTEILTHLRQAAKDASWGDWAKVAGRGYLTQDALLNEAIKRSRA